MELSRRNQTSHELCIIEEQESKIVFLEWKASSDARASREKMSDLTWKIESLQEEIETLNHDRACLKMDIIRLEASLFSAEEGLQLAQASRVTNEKLKQECNDHLKEICDLMAQNRRLKVEQAEYSQVTHSKYVRLSDELCTIIRDCQIMSESIATVICVEANCQRSILSIESQLTALRDTSISCLMEAADVQKELSRAYSLVDDVAKGLTDMVDLSIAANKETYLAVEHAKFLIVEHERLKQELSNFQDGMHFALTECIESRSEVDQLYRYVKSLSSFSGTLSELVCDLRAGVDEFDEIRNENLENDDHVNEIYESASKIASRVHTYLRGLDLSDASYGLPQSVQCLKTMLQRLNETYTPHDESLSELSTVWADHDMSMRCLSQPSQFDILVQYLQGMTRPRSGCGMCLLGGKIYFAGGTDGQCAWDDIEYFDLSIKAWGVASKMPSARICFQLIATREKLVALGGEDAEGNVLASCIEYDPKADSWAELSPMNIGRTGFGALYVHSEGIIVVSGGWNGQNTTASTEIYEIDRDLWIDLELSENYFSTSGCGITQCHSPGPVSEEWQVCSTRDVWRDPQGALVEDVAVDPLCYSLVEVEEMMFKIVSDTLSLNESLDRQMREQCQEFCRYVHLHQVSRRKEKAEDCFNRAKIDSLKSQLLSLRMSEESRMSSGDKIKQFVSNDLQSIVQECVLAIRMISDLIQSENINLSSIMATSSQIHSLQETTKACRVDMISLHLGLEKVFSDLHFVTTGLSDMIGVCTTVRNDIEDADKRAAGLVTEAEQSKCALQVYQAGMRIAVNESCAALCDVLQLQQQFQTDLLSQRHAIILLKNVCNYCEQIRSEISCITERCKQLFDLEQTYFKIRRQPERLDPGLTSETIRPNLKEEARLDEMIGLMREEVIRRVEAEKRVEMLTQMNFEVTTKYQMLLEEKDCAGHPKSTLAKRSRPNLLVDLVPLDPNPAKCVPSETTCKSDPQHLNEMIRLMRAEVIRRIKAEEMVEMLTQINLEVTSSYTKVSETEGKTKQVPIYSEGSKPNQFLKAGASDSVLVKRVTSEAASSREERHLDELIHLLGAEVIRRVEAEKNVEMLTQMNSKLTTNCKFSERLKCRNQAPISPESSRPTCLVKTIPSYSILAEGVTSEAARSSEQEHLDEMIRLMGAEVARRVEAEKMVEMLTQINLEATAKYEKKISDDSSLPEGRDSGILAQSEEHEEQKLELALLYEEKRIVEAALELEIINNKTLRTEIVGLKYQLSCDYHSDSERHQKHAPDAQFCSKSPKSKHSCEDCEGLTNTSEVSTLCHDPVVLVLKETVAARDLELDESDTYIQRFSVEIMSLFSKVSSVLTNLQEKRFLCMRGQCDSGQRLQKEVVLLLDQVAHEAEVAEKVRLLAQEELKMSAKQTQQWRDKYDCAAKTIIQLEQQIAILSTNHEQSLLCNMDLRRSLALVQSDQHSAANTLLWRFSHHATKGCIQELMTDMSITSSSDVSADDPDNKIKEKRESAVSLSCRGNKNAIESNVLNLSSESSSNLQQSGLES